MVPGIKFDTMLVTVRDRRNRKSTIISKLCGEWFNDLLLLSDTKDKTAAEKLQGFWILEIGELAGLKKTEIENTARLYIKAERCVPCVLRSQSDAAFKTVYFHRHNECGTRIPPQRYCWQPTFFPVKVSGELGEKPWQITQNEIDQIWAEALVYYRNKEPLILDEQTEKLAKKLQGVRLWKQTNVRVWCVNTFETLLPVN